jgi:hypothetical protein
MQGCVITTLAKATLLGVAIGLAISARATAQRLVDPETSSVRITYVEPVNPAHQPIMERLKKREVLEDLRDFLSPLRLPAPLLIKVEGCNGNVNAWYSANVVTYCYELIEYIRKSAPKETTDEGITPEDAVLGAFVDIMLHEISHAIFDMLKIPVFGREEDAADQLTAFILLQFGKDAARRTLTGTAHFWGSMSVSQKLEHPILADIHGLRAALLQCAVHRLWRRARPVQRFRSEGAAPERSRRNLRKRISADRARLCRSRRSARRPRRAEEGAGHGMAQAG